MDGLPERFGKYHVLERIAQGGMAEIYKVKTVGIAGFEKIQALKRILPAYAQRPRFIRSFVDEARIAVELNHRNIVQVFDFGKAGGELYLAMELIDGVDLRTVIRDAASRRIDLPIALSCHVLGEVGAGLDYAHRKHDSQGRALDIVHCDVSPQNIVLSREGFVKILDFGIARAHIGTVSTSRRLRGKPRYMAPEQTRGEKPTPATDVFALGIIAWELATGMPLFDGRDLSSILAAVRRAEVPAPSSLNPEVPPTLSAAISRALSLEPEARGSAADLSAALHEAARTLHAGMGSRALSEWLGAIYPPADEHATNVTATEVPVAPRRAVTVELRDSNEEQTAQTVTGTIAQSTDDPLPRTPVTLTERRRVVAVVLVVRGAPETVGQASTMLADLAYKRGAVVHTHEAEHLVVVFGLEIAGEDNVALAMGYSLDAVELVKETGSTDLELRIAARAGVVAQRKGDGYHLVGDAIDEATALARDAEPSRPLLSGGAGRATSAHFAFRELPARRHRRRRLRVLELLGPLSFDERDRALRERRGRFVGRQTELERMTEALAQAERDDRRVSLTLTGRAGVGKSRLVAEFVARASARPEGAPVLVAVSATPASALAPFSVVTDLFQTSLNLPPGRGERDRARFAQRLRHVLERAELAAEEVDEVVGVLDSAMEIRDGAIGIGGGTPADMRDRVASALRVFRGVMLRQGRTLITVLEDMHLADVLSRDIMRAVLRPPPASHAELVVMTSREPLPLQTDPNNRHVDVPELSATDQRDLIRDRLEDSATDAAVEAVASRAGGNPFFIEELAAAVRELGSDRVPPSARDVILSRVDRLAPGAKAALQYAAVIGRDVRARILEEVLGTELRDELTELLIEGFLSRADRGDLEADEGELSFSHGLLQEVVYQSLSAPARRDTHARLGTLLASRYRAGREEPPATIAFHLEEGGLLGEASAFWLRAGRLSLAAYDARAALAHFGKTLALDAELEDRPDRDGEAIAARQREALLGRERAHATLGEHEAQAADLDALTAMCQDVPRVLADVRCRVAEHRSRLGNYAAAVKATEDAEATAVEAGDERLRGEALRIRAEAYERQGRYEHAVDVLQRALEIFRRIGAAGEETRAMIGHGRIHLIRAQYEQASEAYGPILERVNESGDPWLERIAHNHLAVIHLCLGEFETAMRSAQRSVEVCRHLGDRAREGDNLSVCGIILGEVGQFHQAAAQHASALEIHERTGSRWSRADCLVYAGTTATILGDFAGGLARIEEALSIARDIGAKYIEANALVALAGGLLARASSDDSAADDVDRALEAATRAAMTAREASLLGPEIQGLSRQAQAIWRAGYVDAALALSTRAVRLLHRQRYVEGSEEEIYFTHHQLLAAVDSPEAGLALDRARQGFERKLRGLEDPAWRRSFAAIPLHLELQRS
ncbi:MAG TPA: protein kinase [Kofleriaceae bacterium]|nr:protein kinase [Kofleriaceae bacterium]